MNHDHGASLKEELWQKIISSSFLQSCQLNIPSVLTSVTSKESLALWAEGNIRGAEQCNCYLIRCLFLLVLVICQGTPQSLKDKSEARRFIFVLVNAWRKMQNQNKALRAEQRDRKTSPRATEIFKSVGLQWQYRMLNNPCVFSKAHWWICSLISNKAEEEFLRYGYSSPHEKIWTLACFPTHLEA